MKERVTLLSTQYSMEQPVFWHIVDCRGRKGSLQQNFYFDEQKDVFEHFKKAKPVKI